MKSYPEIFDFAEGLMQKAQELCALVPDWRRFSICLGPIRVQTPKLELGTEA